MASHCLTLLRACADALARCSSFLPVAVAFLCAVVVVLLRDDGMWIDPQRVEKALRDGSWHCLALELREDALAGALADSDAPQSAAL